MMKTYTEKRIAAFLMAALMTVCLAPASRAAGFTSEKTVDYDDVQTESEFYNDIQYVISKGFMDGTDQSTFSPSQSVSLELLLQTLYRLDGKPLMLKDPGISDIAYAEWEENALSWASAYGITESLEPEKAGLDELLNREQLAVVLRDYADHDDVDSGNVPLSASPRNLGNICDYAVEAANWVLAAGIMESSQGNDFRPHDYVSREELASAVANYDQADLARVGVVANGMTLIYPSKEQYTICPLRDFYVAGDIDKGVSVPDHARLAVTVNAKDGTLMREVYTDIKNNQEGMWVDYPNIMIEGNREAFRASLMPDLVYDPQRLRSFEDTWIKACYTDEHYTGVVYGGSYKQDINPVDQFGNTLRPLPEGDYDLRVSLKDDRQTLASLNVQITIGVVPKKVLSRFSPDLHFEKVKAYAAEHAYVAFTDPFPGYWNTDMFFPDWGTNYEAEIEKRWALADRQEYIGGMTYFFDYNVSAGSTSYRVELGQLAEDRVLENPGSITYCYYDIGEPLIVQGGKTYEGKFIQKDLTRMPPLVFTRIDFWNEHAKENYIDPEILRTSQSEFDLSSTFELEPGETIWLNGLCQVIQPEEVTFHPETESYTMGNRIAKVRYQVKSSSSGITKYTFTKDIPGLTRVFDNGSSSVSILEFRHAFSVSDSLRGEELYVTAQALDTFGNPVGSPCQVCAFSVPIYD